MDIAELTSFTSNLSALHAWEMNNLPFMHTTTGRHLYYTVAQRAVVERAQLQRSLKDLFTSPHFTEKAMRNRMQEMVDEGFFTTIHGPNDGRNKHLLPTEKFYDQVYSHVNEARRIFKGNFLLIPR